MEDVEEDEEFPWTEEDAMERGFWAWSERHGVRWFEREPPFDWDDQ
jgi:hypothetical protein